MNKIKLSKKFFWTQIEWHKGYYIIISKTSGECSRFQFDMEHWAFKETYKNFIFTRRKLKIC